MNEIISIIKEVGFPIFVCVYLLVFIKQTMEKITSVMQEIVKTNALLHKEIQHLSSDNLFIKQEVLEVKGIIQHCKEKFSHEKFTS